MTENQVQNQAQQTENKPSDKEINFRKIEEKHRREIDQERQARMELEKQVNELKSKKVEVDDYDDNEPYVDHKRLEKKLSSFERKMEEKIEKKAEEKARMMMQSKDESDWQENNKDFDNVMTEDNLMKLVNKAPKLAESIRRMPDGFEKQKLVYNTIKTMGIDKPEEKKSTIQDKIDANRRSPYYQPSGVGAAPYAGSSDFSASGQKNAYDKMQELKNRLRL